MEQSPNIFLTPDGIVQSVNDMACAVAGLPGPIMVGKPLKDHLMPEFRARLDEELTALAAGEQTHTRLSASVIGIDATARALSLGITRNPDGNLVVELSPDSSRGGHIYFTSSSIADSQNLLPVARRLAAICRRAQNRKDLLSDAMAVISEVSNAVCAATIEWGGAVADWPVSATAGQFDQEFLKGIFRSSVIGRLARGDVVVKDALPDGSMVDYSLVLLPLMASRTPEGIVILYVRGNSVISAREQQGLGLLGEIIGMGLKALSSLDGPTEDYQARGAEMEATVALGRLSAGLAHEINNAVTILRNNTEQMAVNAKRFGTGDATDLITEESIRAVETIRGLTDALRAFAPEETRDTEEVDLCRIVDMVVASVRFYAKRGINVSVHSPTDGELVVTCRSHYLIRSLFLIFVELVESALASGRILMVNISLARAHREVTCTVIVSAGPYNFPSVLLSQLDKDGVLVRLTGRAGARLSYEVREEDLSLTLSLPALHGETLKSIAPPAPSTPPSHSILPTPRGTILIVDDEPAIIRSTRRILEKEHDILAAASAAEALDIIRSGRKIDLLLLDVFMPEMSGLDLAEVLKRQHQGLASRIIFITGGASDQEVSRYMARTKLPVLEKPLDIHLLNTRIAEMLTSR